MTEGWEGKIEGGEVGYTLGYMSLKDKHIKIE